MIRIYFDDHEIPLKYIKNLTQAANPFSDTFKLGVTICRTFTLQILNIENLDIPSKVVLYEDDNREQREEWSRYATLYVDEINEDNLDYTEYSLTDGMTKFNVDLTYTVGQTLLEILNTICANHGMTLNSNSFYMDDFALSWEEADITERELISYIAEVNGGYAYIDELGSLNLDVFKKTYNNDNYADLIELKTCSDIRVGSLHNYDRVYLELAQATVFYPETSENDTLYLNPENILFNDAEQYSREAIVQHIYSLINGLKFYNLSITRCPINGFLRAGQIIKIANSKFLATRNDFYIKDQNGKMLEISESNPLLTMINVNWNYNSMWLGGYDLDLQSSMQEETQVVTEKEKRRRLEIKVNRELGEITQRITSNEGEISQLIQDASGLEGYFSNAAGAKYIRLSAEGIVIRESPDSAYAVIDENGFYCYNDDQVRVAAMKENEFDTTNWIFSETRNGNCLNFYKRRTS